MHINSIDKRFDSPKFTNKYGSLTEGIDNDGQIMKVLYMPMFLLQRAAFGSRYGLLFPYNMGSYCASCHPTRLNDILRTLLQTI